MISVWRAAGAVVLLAALAGCNTRAIRDAEAAVLTDPGSVETWVMLGDTYKTARRRDDALAAYQRALALAPDNSEVSARITELGGGGSVTKLERRALRNPLDDELWGDLGDEYAAAGQRDKALSAYIYAFRIDPGDSEWQRKVVEFGGLDQVREMFASDAYTGDDERIGDFGDMLREAGDLEGACEMYTRANEIDPGDSEWIEKLGECGYGGVGHEGVIGGTVGTIGTGANPFASAADEGLIALGRSALVAGDKTKALEYFQAALLSDPTDREALTAVMVLTGNTLVQVLERLTGRIDSNDELWGDLGDAYVAVGQLEDAKAAYERAAGLDPTDSEWQRKLTLLDPGSAMSVPGSGEPLFQLPPEE